MIEFSTPILVIGFNRPDKINTLLVLLSQVKPENIFISIDGPRKGNSKDQTSIDEIIQLVLNKVTWTEPVLNNELFNLGCKDHVIKAITWFFSNVSSGIILEDDCIPQKSFFEYSKILLDEYQLDKEIIMISGNNYGRNQLMSPFSYGFSKYISIWGWATWKDRWVSFLDFYRLLESSSDDELESIQQAICGFLQNRTEGIHRHSNMVKSLGGLIDSWGYILSGFALSQNLLTIIPNYNQITNIGFGPDSTHTRNMSSNESNVPSHSINFPLLHPQHIKINQNYDDIYQPELKANSKSNLFRKLFRWN